MAQLTICILISLLASGQCSTFSVVFYVYIYVYDVGIYGQQYIPRHMDD